MEKEVEEKYLKAGKINSQVMGELRKMLKPGIKLVELADFAEKKIIELGGRPAWPVNTSLNEIAAHYIPMQNDPTEIKPGDLLKIDVGVHIDGYIADSAITYCSEKNPMIEANEKIVNAGIDAVRPGCTVGGIGEAIQQKAEDLGVGLIVNLTGHGLDQGNFHAEPVIPNVRTGNRTVIEEGDVIALEPFVCQSNGTVKDTTPVEIFRYLQDKKVRMPESRKIQAIIRENFEHYPFAKRWLMNSFTPVKVSLALRELENAGAIEGYAPLKEIRGQMVTQVEHTIIVKKKPIVTTKI